MNPLRALLAALTPDAAEHAERTRAVAVSLKTLREDAKAIRREVAALTARADALSRQLAQVRGLRQGEHDAGARLDDLARILDAERVAAHVRAAVDRAARIEQPTARLEMEALWPQDVYEAMIAAIPDPVFFEGAPSSAQVLRVPPRLAPVPAIVAWTFIADIVEAVLVPAVAARFDAAGGPLEVEPGRLVRRPAGSEAPPTSARTWQWGLIEIDVSGANTATARVKPSADDAPLAPEAGSRLTYEVWFGARGTPA